MDLGIAGRKAIVCASSRGLGLACAKALAAAGCEVVINGRNREHLDAAAAELRRTGAKVTTVAADVASPDGQKALFAACPEPDILVNNNAGPPFRDFRELDRQKMLDGLIANMIVAVELTQKAIDPMVAKKFGRIVNITSGSVKAPIAGLDLSSGARAGLTAFLAGVARSVAASNVTINFVLPGIFETVFVQTSKRPRRKEASATMLHLPNASTPFRQSASVSRMNSAPPAHFYVRHRPATSPGRIFSLMGEHFRARSERFRFPPENPYAQNRQSKETSMKLVRFGAPGREKPGMLDAQGRIRDLSKIVPDIAGEALSQKGLAKLRKLNTEKLPLVRGTPRIGPCVGKVGNFIAIGLNYSDHAAEAGMQIPKEPIIFNKAPSCICGPNDDTMIPKDSSKLDWEIELGIVIGQHARYLAKDKALDVVAGYCLANDVSERVFQIERAGQWTKGKGCETFGPLGPWLVTKDEIKNPQNLDMWLDVNGEKRQRGNTSTMIFDCRHIVWACSQYFVLEPGDVIITGTPPGVGLGMKPEPKFLKAGDVVKLGIDGLGEQTQKVVKFKK